MNDGRSRRRNPPGGSIDRYMIMNMLLETLSGNIGRIFQNLYFRLLSLTTDHDSSLFQTIHHQWVWMEDSVYHWIVSMVICETDSVCRQQDHKCDNLNLQCQSHRVMQFPRRNEIYWLITKKIQPHLFSYDPLKVEGPGYETLCNLHLSLISRALSKIEIVENWAG